MSQLKYQLNAGERGLLVEIYLPKKAEFQGRLYAALTEGFHLEKVKNHFREKRDEIEAFLRGRYPLDAGSIEAMEQVFDGYSMYEVDGVFYDRQSGAISEERSQVIRLNFRPEPDKAAALDEEQVRHVTESYLNTGNGADLLKFYAEEGRATTPAVAREITKLLDYLERWRAQVGLFIFGYVVFEICERINELELAKGEPPEREILVTSFSNLTLNRVVRINL